MEMLYRLSWATHNNYVRDMTRPAHWLDRSLDTATNGDL